MQQKYPIINVFNDFSRPKMLFNNGIYIFIYLFRKLTFNILKREREKHLFLQKREKETTISISNIFIFSSGIKWKTDYSIDFIFIHEKTIM